MSEKTICCLECGEPLPIPSPRSSHYIDEKNYSVHCPNCTEANNIRNGMAVSVHGKSVEGSYAWARDQVEKGKNLEELKKLGLSKAIYDRLHDLIWLAYFDEIKKIPPIEFAKMFLHAIDITPLPHQEWLLGLLLEGKETKVIVRWPRRVPYQSPPSAQQLHELFSSEKPQEKTKKPVESHS